MRTLNCQGEAFLLLATFEPYGNGVDGDDNDDDDDTHSGQILRCCLVKKRMSSWLFWLF